MPEILHLNLHREFFDAIAAQAEAHRTASNHTGASGWKIENMTRSCSATAMRRTHRMLVEFRGLRRYGRGRADNETSPSKILASGRGCCRAAGGVALRLGASLPVAAGAHHRGLT